MYKTSAHFQQKHTFVSQKRDRCVGNVGHIVYAVGYSMYSEFRTDGRKFFAEQIPPLKFPPSPQILK